MRLNIDMTSDTPIYRQIRDQIFLGAASGQLKPGEHLPTVRQLAADTGVNPMTVNKAYAMLKADGVVSIDRRHGAQICAVAGGSGVPNAAFDRQAALLIAEAKAQGVSKETLQARLAEITQAIYETEGEFK